MLGTRIILMGMDSFPEALTGQPNAEVVCAANHAIPLYWLLLFSAAELDNYLVDSGDVDNVLTHPQGSKYPILIGDRSDIVARLQQRYTHLKPLVSQADAELLQRWLTFVSELNYPVLAIDTYELWCNMADPSLLHDEIMERLKCIDKLTTSEGEKQLQHLVVSGQWQVNNGIALAGFGW